MPRLFAIIAILLAIAAPATARQPLNEMKPPAFTDNPPVAATKDTLNSLTYNEGLLAVTKGAYALALKNFTETCKLGIGVGCYGVGLLYAQGKGVAVDNAMAAKQFRAACDLTIPEGCSMLGQAELYGRGITKDLPAAANHFAAACNNKRSLAEACTWLAVFNHDGLGIAKNLNASAVLFQKGCTGGDAVGCAGLGQAHQLGEGAKQDYALAAKMYDQGCTRSDRSAIACYAYGRLAEDGLGMKKDEAMAVRFFEAACENGPNKDVYGQACYLAGRAYYDGRGSGFDGNPTEKSLPRASALFRTGCRNDHADSCAGLSLMYFNGQAFDGGTPLPKDRAKAVELARLAYRLDPSNDMAKKILTQLGGAF